MKATGHGHKSRAHVATLPRPARITVRAAIVLGVVGLFVGLGLGLAANPPTAWFAMLEVGLPLTFFGALLGLSTGCVQDGLTKRTS